MTRAALRAALYIRRSTDGGSQDPDSRSVKLQEQMAREYAAELGATVADDAVFVDENISGAFTKGLKARQRLMDLVASGDAPFDIIICRDTDRFSRENPIESLWHMYQIVQAGVEIAFYTSRKTWKCDSVEEQMMAFMSAAMAHKPSADAKKNTAEHMRRKAALGHCLGSVTTGYDHVLVNGHSDYKINHDQKALVIDVFQRFAGGRSGRGIAKDLNADKVTPPAHVRSGSWTPSVINQMLRRDIYRGLLVWNKTKARDKHGARRLTHRPESEWKTVVREDLRIISDDLWNAVQTRLDATRTREATRLNGKGIRRQPHLLSGFGSCTVCGKAMMLHRSQGSTVLRYRLVCDANHHRGDTVCTNNVKLDAADVEAAVRDAVRQEVLDPTVIRLAVKEATDLYAKARSGSGNATTQLRKDIDKLKKDIERLTDVLLDGDGVEAVKVRLKAKERERVERERQLARLTTTAADDAKLSPARVTAEAMKRIDQFTSALLTRNVAEARTVLDAVFSERFQFTPNGHGCTMKMTVDHDRILTRILPPAYHALMIGLPRRSDHKWKKVYTLKFTPAKDGRSAVPRDQHGRYYKAKRATAA